MVGAAQDAPCAVQGNPFELLLNICGGDLGPFTDIANIDIDMQQSLSPTWSLGFLWEPNAWFALGAVYQSEAKMHLKGRYNVDYSADWEGFWQGLRIPRSSGHPFHEHLATDSTVIWPPIPRASGH